MSSVKSSGTHPLLAAYLAELAAHPLRTKAITSGTLCFFQEVLANHIAGVPAPKTAPDAPAPVQALAQAKIDTRAVKMFLYGSLVSAPMQHSLYSLLQKAFAGKTSTQAKIGQILASNLLVAPIQTSVYLACMAYISGGRSMTLSKALNTVKSGFFPTIKITWMVSPVVMVVAQKFLPPDLWVPFFNLVAFVLGSYFQTALKKRLLAAKAKERKDE